MWVRLKVIKHIDQGGRARPHYPGEWVDVGKQTAQSWLVTGDAERPDAPDLTMLSGCGVVTNNSSLAKSAFPGLDVTEADKPAIPYQRTLWWNTAAKLKPDLVIHGFNFLDRWQVCVPLHSYTTLAQDIATGAEYERAVGVLRDMRVLLYEPSVIFIKQGKAGTKLLETWRQESNFYNGRLAFLVALYKVKPLIMALPVEWIK
jgi:hypothetical protein